MSIQLSQKSTKELVGLYNTAAQKLGRKTVSRFADLKTALRRTKEIMEIAGPLELQPTKSRAHRGFNFPVKGTVKALRAGTMRAAIRDEMLERQKDGPGATFEQCVAAVKRYDKKLGVDRDDQEIRTYEAMRLLHSYVGYGMSQPVEDGPITLLTEKQTKH